MTTKTNPAAGDPKETVTIHPDVRRRFILGKQGLWPGRRWSGKKGTAQALRAVEAVQMDPVNVLAPSHDIVLWERVQNYQPEFLASLLYVDRQFFDYGGGLMIYPMEELPFWRVVMERHKVEKRWADFAQAHSGVIDEVRQAIRKRGPLRNRDFEGKSVKNYRASKDTGVALYYLWLTGELMTHSRLGNERFYDFYENIAPRNLQWSANEEDAVQFFVRKAISHLGLVSERDFWNILKGAVNGPVDRRSARLKLEEMVAVHRLGIVSLEGQKDYFYCLFPDVPVIQTLQARQIPETWLPVGPTTSEEVVFLSPLEYVSARGRARVLFDFDYIWEIYKPASKRKYGPYTLPVLYGERLVARLDARLERSRRQLLVNGLWLEDWFVPDDTFALALANGLVRFANFLGAEQVRTDALAPDILRVRVDHCLRSQHLK